MKLEIERKFLLKNDTWKNKASHGILYKQAYLISNPERSVRIRRAGDRAFITIKGTTTTGGSKPEYEYEIPVSDTDVLFTLCQEGSIEKTRYEVSIGKHIWEIDVFGGLNEGLVVAEIELDSVDEKFEIPEWVGEEVTEDKRYINSRLIENPFTTWKK